MSDTTCNLIDHCLSRLFTNARGDKAHRLQLRGKAEEDFGGMVEHCVREVVTDVLGKRIEELETLLLALCNRCGQQCEIIAANAMRRDA